MTYAEKSQKYKEKYKFSALYFEFLNFDKKCQKLI